MSPDRAVAATDPHASVLDLATARRKLDAAIVAERWDAVKVIAERVRELERVGTVDLEAERRRRGR